jgi:branched-chain amino acid aminotransferase
LASWRFVININMLLWLNGEFKDAAEATISAASAGFLSGWGVFTTIGVWAGRSFAFERHLARLRRDAARADVPITYDDSVQDALATLITRNGVHDGVARLTVTRRGDGRWSHTGGSDFCILAKPQTHKSQMPASGLRLVLSPYRIEARRPLAGVKSTSYLDYQLAGREARGRGFDEAVLRNSDSALCECAHSNIFWASNGELCTPALQTGCLAGIARDIVLQWAAEAGIAVHQGVFGVEELSAADEVFVTAATTGPRSVSAFYDESGRAATGFRGAAPGPITAMLCRRWVEATAGHD